MDTIIRRAYRVISGVGGGMFAIPPGVAAVGNQIVDDLDNIIVNEADEEIVHE